MVAMNINTPSYTLATTSTSASLALTPELTNCSSLILKNSGTVEALVLSGVTAPTAVIVAAPGPSIGTFLEPGEITTMTKNVGDGFLAGITASGSANIRIQAGAGE